jgi:NAD(P)-dependent dehydrogenase (short-subunit alcohol dehydrogenase family)
VAARLAGKVALVTGGGNGIGRACAERFAEEGAAVLVADLLDGPGREVVDAITGAGGRAAYAHLDAADPESNEAAAQAAVDELGGLDVLVTAAGISHADYRSGDREADAQLLAQVVEGVLDPAARFADLPLEAWQKVLDVNLTGTFLAVQSATRRMLAAGTGGSIVTIASIAAKHPEAGPVSYAVSKSGVWMLTKHAARSLGPRGIRVNAIGPGFIDTNMTKLISDIPMVRDQFLAALPLGRFGTPAEVAATALFLASDESSYFTGEILHPDGGFFTD